ncbi:4-alpha-glucanotransferase [Streptococcus dentasini]
MKKRTSGVLMHITSLPGERGIGTFGQAAYDFVDFLVETKQSYWQILPLTTTSYGDSPYQSFSAIAGNTNLIDLDLLVADGWLSTVDLARVSFGNNPEEVDYGLLFKVRRPLLEKAVRAFLANRSNSQKLADFEADNQYWLQDYAEFMAIKEYFGQKALQEWEDKKAILRDEGTLTELRRNLADSIDYHRVTQYFFFQQWQTLKGYANKSGIKIIGDMPIYVSADSVEVWTMPELFKVDKERKPLYVAGVPADEFSDEGQYWGNPIYEWSAHKTSGYAWWINRVKESLKLYDVIRIDHFKGFSDFWQVEASQSTAKYGTWQPGPGYDLFRAIKKELGQVPIIAENLGYIDEKAEKLLADTAFPGMKILEFGLQGPNESNFDLPHFYTSHSVAYTGTHDNEVVRGWYQGLSEEARAYTDRYTHRAPGEPVTQALLRTLYATVSDIAIATMQDILDLPASSRMNTPNTVGTNWRWRMTADQLTDDKKEFLKTITETYHRG